MLLLAAAKHTVEFTDKLGDVLRSMSSKTVRINNAPTPKND